MLATGGVAPWRESIMSVRSTVVSFSRGSGGGGSGFPALDVLGVDPRAVARVVHLTCGAHAFELVGGARLGDAQLVGDHTKPDGDAPGEEQRGDPRAGALRGGRDAGASRLGLGLLVVLLVVVHVPQLPPLQGIVAVLVGEGVDQRPGQRA